MDSINDVRFEFFKDFTLHFLPLVGDDITIEQATQLSKCGGGCGGPFWPVRQSPTKSTRQLELEAKRIASKLRIEFEVMNTLPEDPPWWKKNTLYIKWLSLKSDYLKHKYGLKTKPALVVKVMDKAKAFYDITNLEKNIRDFITQAKYSNS
jgi:hypothetical protein